MIISGKHIDSDEKDIYTKLPVTPQTKEDLSINDEGEVELPQQAIEIGVENVFGEKIYGITQNLQDTIKQIQDTHKDDKDETLKRMQDEFHSVVTTELVKTAKENYGADLSKSTMNALERKLNASSDIAVVKSFGDYQIKQNKAELERQKELEQAQKYNKPEMVEAINQKFDQQKQQNKQEFVEKMQSVVEDVIKEAGETIVKVVETDKKQKQKNEIENSIRDHLRGFSRTIPSFLMAYGNEETCLENFDKIIPDEVFKEVTSITLDEFRFLRDGGDYVDAETGDTKHFDGHLFDPIVFNDSVKEFLNLKRKLGNYFDEASKEDIFDYIPPQKTNQIYTPKKVVVEMVDSLLAENPECFDDPNKTFIDLYMKSGLYITEIVKRLYRNEKMKQAFPNDKERLQHIFANQVYGLAPTEIIYRIAIAYILGFSDEIKIEKHNLRQFDTLPAVQSGNLEQKLDEIYG